MPVPYVFVADNAFPLSTNMMKSFLGRSGGIPTPEKIFNYSHSRARGIIENVFEIWSSKFRLLFKSINLASNKVKSVVLTYAYLHNFLP